MDKEIITFGDIEIKKRKFYHRKSLILSEYVDIDSIQISSLVSSGEKSYKYFIGYENDGYKTKPLEIMIQKRALMYKVMMVKLNE